MSDIYDERTAYTDPRELTHKLREYYIKVLHGDVKVGTELIDIHTYNTLALHWPGDEIVERIVRDTVMLLIQNNVNLTNFLYRP